MALTIEKVNIYNIYNVILIRYSEIALKSDQVRKRLLETLIKNIRFQLRRSGIVPEKIWKDRGRVYLKVDLKEYKNAISTLIKVLGILSVSPAIMIGTDFDEILDYISDFANIILKKGDSFGLKTRKVGQHPYSSHDLAVKGGERVLDELGENLELSVNLTNPSHWIYLEAREKSTFIYTDIISTAWTGNPIELSRGGLVITLGRISEFVSAFRVMKRGMYILPLVFSIENSSEKAEHSNEKTEKMDAIIQIFSAFKQYLPINTFYLCVWDYKDFQTLISEKINKSKYPQLAYPLSKMIRFGITNWFIKNQVNIFEELEKIKNLDRRSNIAVPMKKQKEQQETNPNRRQLIDYVCIIDGNDPPSYSEFKGTSYKTVESDSIPIFRAAIAMNEKVLTRNFNRIDPLLKPLIGKIPDIYNFSFSQESEKNDIINFESLEANEFLEKTRDDIFRETGLLGSESNSDSDSGSDVLKFIDLKEI